MASTIALVTGAGAGIGQECALGLAGATIHVIVTDIDRDAAEATHRAIERAGGSSSWYPLDVTHEKQWASVVADVNKRHGRIAILVNNAGWKASLAPDDRSVLELSMDTFDRMMDVNLRGSILGVREILPGMLALGAGAIINMSSVVASHSLPSMGAAYSCTKAAVDALTRSIAVTYGPRQIRCNAVAPGIIVSEAEPVDYETVAPPVGMSYVPTGHPCDIAAVVVFLATKAPTLLSGQVIIVDGGLSARLSGRRFADSQA